MSEKHLPYFLLDYDECSHPDSCMQLCSNSDGNFSCSCVPGYQLTDAGDCKAIGNSYVNTKCYNMFHCMSEQTMLCQNN